MRLRIKEICKSQGVLQKDIADKLGITDIALRASLKGNPTIGTLEKVADALNVHISELFEKDNSELIALIEQNGVYYKAQTLDELNDIVDKLDQDNDYRTDEQKKKDAQIRLKIEKDKQLGKAIKFTSNTMRCYDITISTVEELEVALSDPHNMKDRSKIVWIFNKKEKSIDAYSELRKSLNISSNE